MDIPIDIAITISDYLDNQSFINSILIKKNIYYHKYLIKKRKERKEKYDYQKEFLTILEYLRSQAFE